MDKRIEVAAAVIRHDGKIFATQRGYGEFKDWWEFPGGKLEEGETPQQALEREIREELNARIFVGDLIRTIEWDYPSFHLTMHCFWCTLESGNLTLKEHEAASWLDPDSLHSVRWLPADLDILDEIGRALREEPLIRKATPEDIPRMQEIFAGARKFMAGNGNPDQWADDYPGETLLREDIASGDSYLMVSGGKIVATFVLREGEDPTYREIQGGRWPNTLPYATIHRIAGDGKTRGVLHAAVQFALKSHQAIRIDTHRDNIPMRGAVAKEGFEYCGIIRCWNGTERLAYQLTRKDL